MPGVLAYERDVPIDLIGLAEAKARADAEAAAQARQQAEEDARGADIAETDAANIAAGVAPATPAPAP